MQPYSHRRQREVVVDSFENTSRCFLFVEEVNVDLGPT